MNEDLVGSVRGVLIAGAEMGRVDPHIWGDFERVVAEGGDLEKVGACFTVRVKPGAEVRGDIGGIDDIRCVGLPYAMLPGVVKNEGVWRVDLSPGSRYVEEEGDVLLNSEGQVL